MWTLLPAPHETGDSFLGSEPWGPWEQFENQVICKLRERSELHRRWIVGVVFLFCV